MSLAVRGIASYQEVTQYWDLDEVFAMHEILDIQGDMEAAEVAKMRAQAAASKPR